MSEPRWKQLLGEWVAGSETGAGMLINDTLAEEKAAELRERLEPVAWGVEK